MYGNEYPSPHLTLGIAHCENVLCSSASYTESNASISSPDSLSLVTGMDGLGLVIYAAGGLMISHCSSADCGGFDNKEVAKGADVGGDSSRPDFRLPTTDHQIFILLFFAQVTARGINKYAP